MSKRTLAVGISALALAGVAGGAYAASRSTSDPQSAFINDVARRLHVTSAQLTGAVKQALIDRVTAARAAGHLTQAQANAIKQRIENNPTVPFVPLPLGGPLDGRGRPPFLGPDLVGPPPILTAAASYLGLSDQTVTHQLRQGRSLASLATAHGKSVAGLERAITTAIRSRLDQAVKAGRVPPGLERRLVAGLSRHVHEIVTSAPPSGPPGRPHFPMRPGRRLPGGPIPLPGAPVPVPGGAMLPPPA